MRAALVLVAGCWTGQPAAAPEPPPPSPFSITLERTPCAGSCPAYRVTIGGDGSVRWFGIELVHDHGARHATVPRARIAELRQKLAEVQFFARDPRGKLHGPVDCIRTQHGTSCTFTATICAHTSTAILSVRDAARTHTVRNDHCEPSELEELEALIDDIARTSAWIGGRVDAPLQTEPPP